MHGAKISGMWGDVPFTRILIHHNKVWESMLNCNDYGGIETWQGGPAYVFDNGCALRRGHSPMPTRRSRSYTPGSSMARSFATSRVVNRRALGLPARFDFAP